ncbi:MAG: hypothetical protein HYY37_03140 [Candidatus Aenigmarchaeota archaeon]|nr:hypothetical protein [Candidatus Aenigmarchaeota archaeon]
MLGIPDVREIAAGIDGIFADKPVRKHKARETGYGREPAYNRTLYRGSPTTDRLDEYLELGSTVKIQPLDYELATALHEGHENAYAPHDEVEYRAMQDASGLGIYSPELDRDRAQVLGMQPAYTHDASLAAGPSLRMRNYRDAIYGVAWRLAEKGIKEYHFVTDGMVNVKGAAYKAYRFPYKIAHSIADTPATVRPYMARFAKALQDAGIKVTVSSSNAAQTIQHQWAGARATGQAPPTIPTGIAFPGISGEALIAVLGRYAAFFADLGRVAWAYMIQEGGANQNRAQKYGIAPASKLNPVAIDLSGPWNALGNAIRPPQRAAVAA